MNRRRRPSILTCALLVGSALAGARTGRADATTHRSLAIAGAATAVTGGVLAGVGAAVFVYGAVNNLAASGCDKPCGAVSSGVLRASLIGVGAGLGLAAAGVWMLISSARPDLVQHATPRSPRRRLWIGLLPAAGTPLPRAFALLRF